MRRETKVISIPVVNDYITNLDRSRCLLSLKTFAIRHNLLLWP